MERHIEREMDIEVERVRAIDGFAIEKRQKITKITCNFYACKMAE